MAEPESNRLKLMVVDDEADNLDLLYRTFRRDFEVFKADSGPKALQLLEKHGEMAVIISDQRMPQMNGTEFLSRTVERFPDTLRILLTGYTDVEDLVGAINAGKVFKYITKPWNPKDLRTIVMQAADTYRIVKQRTNELHRALRRESIFNAVITAVRESLDYHSMLQTVVRTIGQTFAADACLLRPVECFNGAACQLAAETFTYTATYTSTDADAPAAVESDLILESPLVDQPINPVDPPSPTLAIPEPDSALLVTLAQACQLQLRSILEPSPYTQLIVPLICQQDPVAVLVLHKHGPMVWTEEEIHLIESVAEQAALAISQAKLYQRIQAQSEQMRAELAVARQIQTNLLRQTFPDLETVKIQAYCFPAREIGGDFFEIYVHPQGDIWLAVGDVSGKGVPAALFMTSAISLLRRELAQEISPAPDTVMQNLNHSLSDNLVNSNCFITLVLVRYRPATGELLYANAGHIYPLVWSQRQLERERQTAGVVNLEPVYLKTRGVPLGILPVWKAAAGQLTLQSGDVLLLTSDGITEVALESSAQKRMMLHQVGLWQLIMQQPGALNLKDLLSVIQMKTQVQEDDQTILSLEVL